MTAQAVHASHVSDISTKRPPSVRLMWHVRRIEWENRSKVAKPCGGIPVRLGHGEGVEQQCAELLGVLLGDPVGRAVHDLKAIGASDVFGAQLCAFL